MPPTDKSGTLDMTEVLQLASKLNIAMSERKLKKEFAVMDVQQRGAVPFTAFAEWWNTKKELERRESRRHVKDIFDSFDRDQGGTLDKEEMARMCSRAMKRLKIDDFNLEDDWEAMHKEPRGGVTFSAFEAWWKDRMGITDAEIPVLPEYMVQKISEADRGRVSAAGVGSRNGKQLWDILRPRLKMLVKMQTEWGSVNELYDSSSSSSLFITVPVPEWIRDPDSPFSVGWDLSQVFFLLYVAILVPLRICFDISLQMLSVRAPHPQILITLNPSTEVFIGLAFRNLRVLYAKRTGS